MKVLIIEDEMPAAQKLKKLVHEIDLSIEILGILESIDDTVLWLQNNQFPDLIMMDIHLADGSSFEIFKEIDIECPVIFITAFDEYAIDAFKVNSVDYLLKPVKREDLETAILKFKNLQHTYSRVPVDTLVGSAGKHYKDTFVIKIGTRIKSLDINNIAYFFSKGKLTFIGEHDGRTYPLNLSLDKIQLLLDPHSFFRVNRQILAHRASIKEIQMLDKSKIKLHLEPPLKIESVISTERTSVFKKWLNKEL